MQPDLGAGSTSGVGPSPLQSRRGVVEQGKPDPTTPSSSQHQTAPSYDRPMASLRVFGFSLSKIWPKSPSWIWAFFGLFCDAKVKGFFALCEALDQKSRPKIPFLAPLGSQAILWRKCLLFTVTGDGNSGLSARCWHCHGIFFSEASLELDGEFNTPPMQTNAS